MGHLLGYARVSTAEQELALQTDALTSAGCSRVYSDVASGSLTERPELTRLLERADDGDTLVVWRLDRLGRSLPHLVETVTGLGARGVGFRSLQESIDTTTPGGRLVFHVFASLAEFERDLIRDRTMAGLAAAKRRGRVGGRPTVMTPAKLRQLQRMQADGDSPAEIAAALGVGRATVYRHLAPRPAQPPAQTTLPLPELPEQPAEPDRNRPAVSPVRLLGREVRGNDLLECLTWPAGYAPPCPACAHLTDGLEEQYARVCGVREPVVVALAQPCGCQVDDHAAALQAGAAAHSSA